MDHLDEHASHPLLSGISAVPGFSEIALDPGLIARLAEYGQALARGSSVDRDQLIASYPKIAEQLTDYLNALEFVHAAFAGTAASPPGLLQEGGARTPSDTRRVLGDFRILAERGRGGMGVVYEAEQQSLQRRVAVKVLLGAIALSPGQLQRFKNEALAAASLNHPNIVKVYSVGCDRGVHYYAMQYIEGESLAEVILALQHGQLGGETCRNGPSSRGESTTKVAPGVQRSTERPNRIATTSDTAAQPGSPCEDHGNPAVERPVHLPPSARRGEHFSFVARLGIEAAEALEHAHRMGVIHRDIKPSNLLLDSTGHLWVTDFGLALMQAGTAVTLTGDIVGTLRYMSPEQALGQRHLLNQSTDIYSLGSTLYELLTLQPPFPEEDRHALLGLLAEHDPPPPRRINSAVPRDLETIVMKCLAKEPSARYVSAKALADDLQRFLADTPILAQRPSMPARLGKWSRRHRSIVYSAALLLGLVFVGLVVANWRIAQERNVARQAAERERQMGAVAESERRRAEANFEKAREAVDRGVRRAAEEMADQPQMESIRRILLEDALEFYQGFLMQKKDDMVISHETAMAYYQVGYIQVLLGQYQKCIKPLEQSLRLLEELVARNPEEVQYRLDLAKPYGQLAYATMWARRNDVAISYRRKKLAVLEQLHRDFPNVLEYWRLTASAHSDLGVVLRDAGDPKAAIEQFRQAMALCEQERAAFPDVPADRNVVAHIHHWWGYSLEASYEWMAAETHYRAAHQLRAESLAEQPTNAERKHLLGHVKTYLASLLLTIGKPKEAEALLRETIAIDEDILRQFPNTADYRRRAGFDYTLWGRFLAAENRPVEAEAALRRCVAIFAETVVDRPEVETHLLALAWGRFYLGSFLDAHGRSVEAADVFRAAMQGFEAVAAAHPDNVDCQGDLGRLLVTCPAVQFRDPPRAVRLLQQATEHQPWNPIRWAALGLAQNRVGDATAALRSIETAKQLTNGGESCIWLLLAMTHQRLGHDQEARTWQQKAVALIDKLHPIEEDNYRLRTEVESLMKSDSHED